MSIIAILVQFWKFAESDLEHSYEKEERFRISLQQCSCMTHRINLCLTPNKASAAIQLIQNFIF